MYVKNNGCADQVESRPNPENRGENICATRIIQRQHNKKCVLNPKMDSNDFAAVLLTVY